MLNEYLTPTHTDDSLTAKSARPPFGYYGAKARIASKIVEMLPPHNAWVEGFCGSAALTLAKPPVPIEIINDVDGEIVNLFKQLRSNSKKLCELVALTPYSRQEFEEFRDNPRKVKITDMERARIFLVTTMMAINGTNGLVKSGFSCSQSYTRQNREARVNRWYRLPDRLEKVVERLRGVRIENRDACDLVKLFANRPATLMYLDPPYFMKRQHGYAIDQNNLEFHQKLVDVCKKARCMILLSGYENSLYKKELTRANGWEKKKIQTKTRDTTGRDFPRTEILWMNASFVKAKNENQVPIRLNNYEKKNHKVNPPRT